MRARIQKSMILVITATLFIAYGITIFFMYGRMKTLTRNHLKEEGNYLAAAINISGEKYLKELDEVEKNTRVTLINSKGSVLYDSEEDEYTFANHEDRLEFQAALKKGSGTDVRRSDTLRQDMFYYARLLKDGNVIRVSTAARTVLFTALDYLPLMMILGVTMLFAAWLYSKYQAEALIRPINELNLDDPIGNNHVYDEIKPLLKRIDEQNKEKDAVADMRTEFSANVSHELRTPLTSISGYAEIMKNKLVRQEDIPEFSARIYKEANRMISLIDDIMKLSKLDEGGIALKDERVDLYQTAEDVIHSLEPNAVRNEVSLSLEGTHAEVVGIRHLIREMMFNVTDNAIKYNVRNGRVDLSVSQKEDGCLVRIADTGIGIPEDQLERIFERFYRVDKSRSKATGGTGLGLSIVKHGAQVSRAKIHIKSQPGQGTEVEFLFPYKRVPEMDI